MRGGPTISEPLLLPPGFELVPLAGTAAFAVAEPFAAAVADACGGADPGRVHWQDGPACVAAVVLTPDRVVVAEVVEHLALLALYDALATVAPPQVPVSIVLPETIRVDGARVGGVRVALGAGWAVAGFVVAMRSGYSEPDLCQPGVSEPGMSEPGVAEPGMAEPGERPGETCLMEEGFGDVSGADLLGAFCRHLLVWVDAWQDEGAAGLARSVRQRVLRVPA